jgi:DNA-binding MarR family transcriptional regulator
VNTAQRAKRARTNQHGRPSQRPDIEHPALSDRPDLGILLAIASRTFGDALQARLENAGFDGLRPAHTYTLQALHETLMTPGELARFLRVTRPAAGKVLDELEALGLVERRPTSKDRRSTVAELTKQGQDAWRVSVSVGDELEKWLTAAMGPRKGSGARACLLAIARRYARK